MAHDMGEAPSYIRNAFTSFYTDVRRLYDYQFIARLSNRNPDHYLYRALLDLQKAAEAAANETQWQGPLSAATMHTPQNSYDGGWSRRPAHRPSTPNYSAGDGLRPGPFTPEPSPSRYASSDTGSNRSSANVSDLSNRNARLEQKLEQSNRNFLVEQRAHQATESALKDSQEQVGHLNRALQERERKLASTRKELEARYRDIIDFCEQAQKYEDAIQHLDQLYVLSLEVVQFFDRNGDPEAAKSAKDRSLDYQQQKGRMLSLACRYADAEVVLRRNLKSRKDRFGSDDVTSRDVQLLLCQALRKQRLGEKTAEAEALYYKHALVTRLEGKDESSREWAFRNAAGLAATLVELEDYKHAMPQIQDLWENRSKVPASYIRKLDSEILSIVAMLESRGDPGPLIDGLRIICSSDPTRVNSRILPCYIQLGRLLQETGGKEANGEAITYLQNAWIHRERVDVDDQRSTLQALVLSHATLDHWKEAKALFDDLKRYDNSQGTPSADMITALNARLQFNEGHFSKALNTAASLYGKYGTENVLKPATSLHQVDTLIKSASKQKDKDGLRQAKKIWDDIYKDASGGQLSRQEMRAFAATGKVFADSWEICMKKEKKENVTIARKIRENARDMLQWAKE